MNKQKLFLIAACVCFPAFAAEYTWTGDGNDGLWTTSANWGLASGYPNDADAEVKFSKSANVSLNTGAQTDVAYINVTAGNVVLTATEGSSLKLNWPGYNNPTGKTGNRGLMVSDGASLEIAAPLATITGRFDRQGTGRLTIRDIEMAQPSGVWYIFNGTNEFAGTASVSMPNAEFTVGLGTPRDRSFVLIKDSAQIVTKQFSTSSGGSPVPDTKVIQDGEGTVVSVSGRLDLRNNSANDDHCYTLKSGTLSASELQIAPNGNASASYAPEHLHYIQEGGTSTFSTVTLTKGSAALRGGVMNIPNLAAITIDNGSAFNLEGGTIALADGAFTSWRDCLDKVGAKLTVSPGSSVALNGLTSLSIPSSFSTYDIGLEIGVGKTVTIPDYTKVSAPAGSANSWKVTLNDGSVLELSDGTTQVLAPLDLTVNGTGKIQMRSSRDGYGGGSRNTVVARRLVVNGVEKAKGRYTASANSFLEAGTVASVNGAAAILVPTIWTGAGGDTLWSNPANWDNKVVPNGTTAVADVSEATIITLDQDVSLNALVAIPNGASRKVTLTGSKTVTLCSSASYQCNIFLPVDCELVLDVNLTRNSGNVFGVFGGGKLTAKKAFPGCTSGLVPYMAIDGTLAFAGSSASIANIPTSNYAFLSLWTYENMAGNVLIEDGATFIAARLWNGANDYVQPYEFRQKDATVTLNTFYLNRGNSISIGNPLKGSPFYCLDGGSLTVPATLNLGRSLGPTDSKKRFPGGSFEMSGGRLNCWGFNGGCNQNYVNLYGGDLYLSGDSSKKNGGFYASFNPVVVSGKETVVQTNKNDYTYYLGGVTIHPSTTGYTIGTGNVYLTGKNGDAKFALDSYALVINSGNVVAGPGGIEVVSGSYTLTSKANCTFTGAITLSSGNFAFQEGTLNGPTAFVVKNSASKISIGSGCTISKSPETIVLAAASCLDLGLGRNLTVKRLVVNGTEYPASGSPYTFNNGTVTVTGVAPASWEVNGVGDLSYMPDGTTTTVDAATTLSSLVYNPVAAGETNMLTGAALTFEDGANIHVEKGATLVISNDVVFAGKITKTGWGEVVFNGAVSSSVTPAADDDNYWLTVTEGGATFDGAVTGVRLVTCGAIDGLGVPVITLKENCTVSNYGIVLTAWNETNVACCGETHQEGAIVDYSTTIFDDLIYNRSNWALTQPRAGGYGRYVLDSGELRGHNSFHLSFVMASNDSLGGTFEFVQNDGTLIIPKNWMFARVTSGVKFTYTLNDGRFELGGYLGAYANPSLNFLNLNGGTYVANASDVIKREAFTLTTSGEVTFEVASGKTLTIQNDSRAATSFVKKGAGALVLDGALPFGGKLDVQAGSVTLTDKMLPFADGTTEFSVAKTGATLNLDYDGQMPVKLLTMAGVECSAGVYSASKGPLRVRSRLGGTGELNALTGHGLGTLIILR